MTHPQLANRRVLVTFDAELARRTALHRDAHPVAPDDPYFDAVGDSGPVARALEAHGAQVQVLGLDRRAASQLEDVGPESTDLVFNLCDTLGAQSRLAPLVPTLLEARGVPVVGADQFGLAISKRKHDVKALLDRETLPTPRYQVIDDGASLAKFQLTLTAPVILKLTAEHSSIGIEATSVCFTADEVKARAAFLLERFQQPVLIEEYVGGREFYVSFYGDPLMPLPLMEHTFEGLPAGYLPIRTFDMKWFNDPGKSGEQPHSPTDTRWAQPVPLRRPSVESGAGLEDLERVCKRAFEVVGGRDWGRVDLRLDRGGIPMIIDVTPNTYLGPSAPCAKAAAVAGLNYDALVAAIAVGAFSRSAR